jgi:ATP-binding cassette, subfamily B, bacterial PglK
MPIYKKILQLLTPKERRRGYLLLFMILVMAFLDTIGVASIVPFMAVLGDPDIVESNRWLAMAYDKMGFTDHRSFFFFLGLGVFVLLVSSTAFKALTQWALLRFSHMRNYSFSTRLFKSYLGRPYIWFLNRHTSDMGKSVLSEVYIVTNHVLIPLMQLIAHGTAALFLIILLILVNPILSLMVALTLGGSYFLIYTGIRNYISRIGKDRVEANKERFKIAHEALSSIKEVKIFGREHFFFKRFINPSFRYAKCQANNQIAGVLPRYILEVVAFGGILLITLYLFRSHGNFSQVLPILAVYAFAGYRLLPALQNVYQHMTTLRFGLPSLDILHQDIIEGIYDGHVIKGQLSELIVPQCLISLKNISFKYPGAHVAAIKGLDLEIPANSTIGLAGTTGSGKTTLVDIILGLLWPEKGQLLVDDTMITKYNVQFWQQALGYVPQQINLADDSVSANIAFGIPPEEIEMDAVIRAAKVAELHEFITQDLDKGYDTLVGERGVRLSGGQRQRIGIARALYHDPRVLVMDEASSSLDNITEKNVMQAIQRMKGERTIILIAHRLTTLSGCDRIYFLDQGQVKAQGTFDELVEQNDQFRNMARGIARDE